MIEEKRRFGKGKTREEEKEGKVTKIALFSLDFLLDGRIGTVQVSNGGLSHDRTGLGVRAHEKWENQ